MKIPAYLLSLLLAAVSATASEPAIEGLQVHDNIHMLIGKGGNIGLLIGDDGTFMIDDKFAPLTDAILAEIRKIGGDTPKFVINTHFHGDHTGGNENLGRAGSILVSHENVRRQLAAGFEIDVFNIVTPPQAGKALPVITFKRDIRFHLNGNRVDIVHVPAAHTDGDSFVHFHDANVIHTGDTVFNGFFPFIDVAHGGTLDGVIAAVDRMLALADPDTRIIPGHGPLADKPQLQAYRDMLATARERLGRLKAEGKSAAEAAAEQPLADLDAEWGDGMFTAERWIRIIYDGI